MFLECENMCLKIIKCVLIDQKFGVKNFPERMASMGLVVLNSRYLRFLF